LEVTDMAGYTVTQVQTVNINPFSAPLEISYGLVAAVVIPALWVPALALYFIRNKRKWKKV
jgi:hypothetical protein